MTWEETVKELKELSRSSVPVDLQTGNVTVQGAVLMVLGGGDTLTIETEKSHWQHKVIHREEFEGAEWITEGSDRVVELRFKDGDRMRILIPPH